MQPASPPPPLSPAWAMDSSGNTPTAVRKDGWYVIRTTDHVYVGHDHRTLNGSEIDVFKKHLYPHLEVQAVVRLTENPGLVQLRVQIVWPGHLGGVEYFARDVDTVFPVTVFEPPRPLPPTPPSKELERTVARAFYEGRLAGAEEERLAVTAFLCRNENRPTSVSEASYAIDCGHHRGMGGGASIDPTTVRDAIRSALVEGGAAERAAIAAWLRGEAKDARKVVREHGASAALSEHAAYEDAALRIERGEHIPTITEEGT